MKRTSILLLGLVASGCGGGSHQVSGGGSGIAPEIVRVVIATNLDQPAQYVPNPVDAHLAYVVELPGRVRLLVDDKFQSAPVLDLSSRVYREDECGMQSMVFAPDFASSRAFYVYYNTQDSGIVHTRVTRCLMSTDGRSATVSGDVVTIAQPYTNHKGGAIRFGGDGDLYLALGDGGSEYDPDNRAQDPTSLLGKVLRLDLRGDDFPNDPENNYRIPLDNPFVKNSGVRGEIWDFGLRNPFRWTIDEKTKSLLIADVGQDRYEELNYEPAGKGGRNYGWRAREGLHSSGLDPALYSPAINPFLEYDHSVGRSIIGGYIVRTSKLGLKDRYLFGDFLDNHVWALPLAFTGGEASPRSVADAREIKVDGGWSTIVSIDPDFYGEPVVTEVFLGQVSRLVPKT